MKRYICIVILALFTNNGVLHALAQEDTRQLAQLLKNPGQFFKKQKRRADKNRGTQGQQLKEEEQKARLKEEIQPHVDRVARQMVRLRHWDPLVHGYVNSIGQSLIPPETPSSVTFSFRAIDDFRPNAFALPDGRIFVTTGLLAFVENEAQLAVVLGHEIAHVIEEHKLDMLQKQRTSERRNKMLGAAAGAALGGFLGSRRGGAGQTVAGAAAGAGVGVGVAVAVNQVLRAKYSRDQEREADLIGSELAMARGFDPEEGVNFFDKQHARFGHRSFSLANALMGSHPPANERAANIQAVLAGDLSQPFQSKRSAGELATGIGRFGRLMSGMIRDNGILLAERSDRFDLALENLDKAQRYRPNDPRVLWALGRIYRMVGRTDDQLDQAREFLMRAAEADQRKLYPAIHRDLAYLHATRGNDFDAATESLKQYVLGHIATHRALPADIEEVYDQMVLFGENAWMAPEIEGSDPKPAQVVYRPTVWDTPGRGLERYDAAYSSFSADTPKAFATETMPAATLK